MEQVIPWQDPLDLDTDPILEAVELRQTDLRCLHGFGLCLWRLERFDEAERVFERMLWFNPTDNQGVRFLIDHVRAGVVWEDHEFE